MPIRVLRYLRRSFRTLILAYSGGTDSTLLLLVCKHHDVPLDLVVWNNTRLEYPDTIGYICRVIPALGYRDVFRELQPEVTAKQLGDMIVEDFTYRRSSFKTSFVRYFASISAFASQ